MLATKGVVSFIARLVSPSFNTIAVLQVIFPHAFVLGAIHMLVDASAIGFVIGPVPVIDVAVHMNESAFPVRSIFSPFTAILRTIRPGLFTESISESTLPLACVHSTSLESVGWSLFALLVWVVDVLCHSFTGLFLSEILAAPHLFGFQERDKLSSPVSSVPSLEFNDEFHI